MSKVKLVYIIILFSLLLSCEEKNLTESIETAQLIGYVYQALNGFSNRIPDAEISIGAYNTTSDSLGLYRLEIPVGEHAIQISHDFFDTTIDTINVRGDRSYLINLLNGPNSSVSGILTDTLGDVVEGAVVELDHLRDTTDLNGIFEFSEILTGSRILSCDYLDYYLFIDTLEITDRDMIKNISLVRQGYTISGTVSHPVDGLLSGIEVILDGSLYDTTNINGEYFFENIFIGEHQLQVNSEIYDNQVIGFSLDKADLLQNILLTKPLLLKVLGTVSHPVDGLLSGVEVLLDDSLYDTTNVNGEYLFENIFIGEHQLQVNSANYNYDIFQFSLVDSDLYKDLIVGKSVIEKIMVENDAMIKYYLHKDYDSMSYTQYVNINYGDNNRIDVHYYHYQDISIQLGSYIDHIMSRVFIKLPSINYESIDSAQLVFSSAFYLDPVSIEISNLQTDWDEQTISWSNQPVQNDLSIVNQTVLDDSLRWIVNISENYELFTSSNGFRIRFQIEDCYTGSICSGILPLFSSEYPILDKRPYVLIYRTE